MIVYAIKEYNTGLYISLTGRLEPLGDRSRLFKTRYDAMRAIEYNMDEFKMTPIVDELVWQELELEFGKDRWHINISSDMLDEYRKKFKIGVCKIELQEIDEEIY